MRSAGADDVAILLDYARKVVVVPGYGLAVAQAQHTIRELAEVLEAKGVEVVYGIHPVAGRMPGHMNVLLAEANVPYEALKEMDEVNPEFKTTDVVARGRRQRRRQPGREDDARARRSTGCRSSRCPTRSRWCSSSGRCGRGSPASRTSCSTTPQTTLLFGDAKDSLTKVLGALKTL